MLPARSGLASWLGCDRKGFVECVECLEIAHDVVIEQRIAT
jgi:hypothetical protein